MDLRWYAWLTVLFPVAAVHLAYLVSITQGSVEACIPYWDGCTSISRAGRHGLANLLFKGLMLPHAAQLMGFWLLSWAWLRKLRPDADRRTHAVLALGVIAAAFLVLYASFLGAEGETYRWLRRYGINVFFSFSVLAQMLVIALLTPVPVLGAGLRTAMLSFAAALLLLGLASLPLRHFAEGADHAMNALEWIYALLMAIFYGLIGIAWGVTGYRLEASTATGTSGSKPL
ncbi:MAG: hypothetical protein ACPHN2_12820 [Sinimarinibacterium flocculans]|uniref:hypothetical protein n=1 Tax=Sinimarinibacterium flocculans TaxID=985250 RepID=UPI003C622E1F